MTRIRLWWCVVSLSLLAACSAQPVASAPDAGLHEKKSGEKSAFREKTPSEDPVIGDFHALGTINGSDKLFRSASPLRDLAKAGTIKPDSPEAHAAAAERMTGLYARGIRTIISFEKADTDEKEDKAAWMALEKNAAVNAGLHFVSHPMANSGTHSLQDESHEEVLKTLRSVSDEIFKDANDGGVLIHCSAGHDRTGIVVAYLRVAYQHWSADKAIQEMRDFGHNWVKYSSNGGQSSWHEEHIRAIAAMMSK